MATKIIKAWIDGAIQNIEVEEMTSPEQPLSVEERVDTLEGKHEVVISEGSMLVGDGTPELKEMTPEEVREHIKASNFLPLTTSEYESLEYDANTLYMLTDSEDIYIQNEEPTNAEEGTLWIDLDAEGTVGGTGANTGGGSVNIDTTLTKSGQSADAKAVGDALATKQPIGDYVLRSEIPTDVDGLASESYVEEKVAALVNSAPETLNTLDELAAALGDDANFATTIATELGNKANTADLGELASKDTVSKSDLASDVQSSLNKADTALQSYTETDPTVPAWAKTASKPSYTKSEIGLGNVDNTSDANKPVSTAQAIAIADAKKAGTDAQSNLTAHINNKSNPHGVTASQVGADASGTAENMVSTHNEDTMAHTDIREQINNLFLEIADKEQLTPEFAESIEDCTDTTKMYVLPDGFIYAYASTTTTGATYTNIFDTIEHQINTRWSHSSKAYSASNATGHVATAKFPVKDGDIIRINKEKIPYLQRGYARFHYFDSSGNYVNGHGDAAITGYTSITTKNGISSWEVGTVYNTLNNTSSGIKKLAGAADITQMLLVLCVNETTAITEDDIADIIITVNQPIEESTVTTSQWINTGHAFVPADYEDRILVVEAKADENAAEIASLKENSIADNKTSLMFIAPNGSDSNDGLTASTPKKTVKACVNAGATKISAKRGVYNEIVQLWDIGELEIFPTDNDLTYDVGLERESIVFDTSDSLAVSSLAAYNSIKRVAYSNSANTQFDKVFTKKSQTPIYGDGNGSRYNATIWLLSSDEKSVCIKLKPVLTVAECEAEANTFTYVSGYIYINADMTNVAKVIVPTNWDCGIYINGAERFVLKEVEVRFAGSYNIDIRNCAYFDFYKCACKYTSYGSGFHPYNSNGRMTACYATKNYDGYGISGYGHTTYVDCVSEFNFDDGMSHHNATEGTVIGGRYEGNGKGGITPAYGAKVNIYGGIYKNNASFGIGYLWASGLEAAEGTVDGAVIVGNPTGLVVQANCNVVASNCIYEGNTTDKEIKGNLTEYNNSYVSNGENGGSGNENNGSVSGYTNVLPSATMGSDQAIGWVDGGGYTTQARLSSSGGNVVTNITAVDGMCASGYIPVSEGDVIRIKGFFPPHGLSAYVITYNDTTIVANKPFRAANNINSGDGTWQWTEGDWYELDKLAPIMEATVTFTLTSANFGSGFNAIRFSGIITDDTIVTINEKIVTQNSGSNGDSSSNETLDEALYRIKNWKYPIHEDAPVFLLETNKPAIDSNEQTTDAVYAKYDALMAANPGFITKVNCGKASDNSTQIYVYHFREAEPHYSSPNWSETKPVILVCSGVHPTEQSGVHSLYYAMEEITTNPKLHDLRRNVHFIVMPMINPTGFTDTTYGVRNPDGIQVHYNFEVDFKYPTDSGYVVNGNRNHGGEAPLSIPETQYFDAIMNEYKDNLAIVVSCHNNDVDEQYGTGFIWCSCATHFMCNLGFRFVDKMSAAWREKYGDAFDEGVRWANEYALAQAEAGSSMFNAAYIKEQPEWDFRVGRASISGSGGTEYKQALKYGVHGINVETCDRCMILDKDFTKKRTANVTTMGCETYVNFFRTFMAVYDPKDKKLYS